MVWGAIAGAAASLIGSYLSNQSGSNNTKDANATNLDLAKHRIQYTVRDANRAGIHPLYALGAPTFGPVATAFQPQNMGQDISRVVDAVSTPRQRQEVREAVPARTKAQLISENLTLQHQELENELLRSQIGRIRQQSQPPAPDPAGLPRAHSGQVDMQPARPTVGYGSSQPGREAGVVQEYGLARTSQGGYAVVPSHDMEEKLEDNLLVQAPWYWRNGVLPNFGQGPKPPPGYHWSIPQQQFVRNSRTRGNSAAPRPRRYSPFYFEVERAR